MDHQSTSAARAAAFDDRAAAAESRAALVVIDMQRDFLPGGALAVGSSALAVGGNDELVRSIERVASRFEHVILTTDWHPAGHISFAGTHPGKSPFVDTVDVAYGNQALWPDHCVQGTPGAEIAVHIPHAELLLRKGFRRAVDSYSAFLENDHSTPTGLAGYLRERGLTQLYFCGLAFDFCVGSSAVDGAAAGFHCAVLEGLTRSVDLPGSAALPGSVAAMRARLLAAGVRLPHSDELSV